jgi:hypothetical protein
MVPTTWFRVRKRSHQSEAGVRLRSPLLLRTRRAGKPSVELLEGRVLLHSQYLTAADLVEIKWTFGDSALNDYVLTSFSPQDANLGPIGGRQPTLRLVIGSRYSVTVSDPITQPIQIIAKGASPFEDVVLLAQNSPVLDPGSDLGLFESDPAVAFEDDGQGTVRFTLTQALADAMIDPTQGLYPGYRSGQPFNRTFQRGDFTLVSGDALAKNLSDDFANSFDGASFLILDSSGSASLPGGIDFAGDVDLFRFVAPVSGRLTVTQTAAAGSSLAGVLFGFDSRQKQLALGIQDPSLGQGSRLDFDVREGQTYFVQVAGFRASTGEYQLTFATEVQQGPFPGAVYVPLDDAGQGTVLGTIALPGMGDPYYIVPPVTGRMTLTQRALSGSYLDSHLSVQDATGILLASDDDSGGGLDSRLVLYVLAGEPSLVRAAGHIHYTVTDGDLLPDPLLSTGAYELIFTTDDFRDTFVAAALVTLDRTGSGSRSGLIETAEDADLFQFVAPVTGELTIALTPEPGGSLEGCLAVFDGDQAPLGTSQDHVAGTTRVQLAVTAGQTYFVEVSGQGPGTGRYRLQFAVDDFADTFADAHLLSFQGAGVVSQAGEIGTPGDVDVFRFVATESGEVVVTQNAAAGTALDSLLSAFDATVTYRLLARSDDDGGGRNSQLRFWARAGHTYYIQASGFGTDIGRYDLTFALDDFGDTLAGAHTLHLDETGSGRQSGSIGPGGDVDVYRVVAPTTGSLPVTLTAARGSTFDGRLEVFDAQQERLVADDDGAGGSNSRVHVDAVADQTYFVHVAGFGTSTGAYDLIVGDDSPATFADGPVVVLDSSGSGEQAGRLEHADDVDVFRFVAPVSGELTVLLAPDQGSSLKVSLSAFGPEQALLGSDFDEGKGFAQVRLSVTTGQVYFLQAAGDGSGAGRYALRLGVDDFSDGLPMREAEQSVTFDVDTPASRQGEVEVPFDQDAFEFVAAAAGEVVITQVTAPGSNLRTSLTVFPNGAGGDGVASTDVDRTGRGFSRVQLTVAARQRVTIFVGGSGSSTGRYDLGFQLIAPDSQDLQTQDLQATTAEALVNALVGANSGITVVPGSIQYTGSSQAAGIFNSGASSVGLDSGVVLTTGKADKVRGPNFNDAATAVNDTAGSPQLDRLVQGETRDAAVLSFDFIATVSNVVRFRYVFASEEYNEFVGSPFNDVFAFYVNGVNHALLPGASIGEVVSIDHVNQGVNSDLFVNNEAGLDNFQRLLKTQLDGLTRILTVEAPVRVGQVNRITLAIADTVDPRYDSAVFIEAGSFQTYTETVAAPAGVKQFDRLVRAIAEVTAQGTGMPEALLHRLIHKAVVNGVIREVDLLGDFLVVPVDPVDFTLTNERGLKVDLRQGQGSVSGVGNAFFISDGPNQLLILPNARAEQYRVELVGVGSGEFRFGASFVTAFGEVTTILLNGNLRDGRTVAVLDFASLDGRIVQQSVLSPAAAQSDPTQPVASVPAASVPEAPVPAASVPVASVPAVPVDVEPPHVAVPDRQAASVNENVFLAALLTSVVVVPQVPNGAPAEAGVQGAGSASALDIRVASAPARLTSGSDTQSESSLRDFLAIVDQVFQAVPPAGADTASWQDLAASGEAGLDLILSILSARPEGPGQAWADLVSPDVLNGLLDGLGQAGRATLNGLGQYLRSQLRGEGEPATPVGEDQGSPLLGDQHPDRLRREHSLGVTQASAELLLGAWFAAGAWGVTGNRHHRRRASLPTKGSR